MSKHTCPQYIDLNSTQTLQEGLEEYYRLNPEITDPRELPPEFARILLAHDVSHVILGCDTTMYDEIKLLPLSFWTSDFKFADYIRTNRDPKIKPAIAIMYRDLIEQHGRLWLYGSILLVLPRLLPELIYLWHKIEHNNENRRYYPFFNYESLLERSLWNIRQKYNLLPLINSNREQLMLRN